LYRFKPGDYIGINLPQVALYEFHPFTISSAPEESDYLRVHIQVVGNWTKQVYQRFKDMSDDDTRENYQLKIYRAMDRTHHVHVMYLIVNMLF
jgi:predicted ferric reductase